MHVQTLFLITDPDLRWKLAPSFLPSLHHRQRSRLKRRRNFLARKALKPQANPAREPDPWKVVSSSPRRSSPQQGLLPQRSSLEPRGGQSRWREDWAALVPWSHFLSSPEGVFSKFRRLLPSWNFIPNPPSGCSEQEVQVRAFRGH